MKAKRGTYVIRTDEGAIDLACLSLKQKKFLNEMSKTLLDQGEFDEPLLSSIAAFLILVDEESESLNWQPGFGLLQ